MDQKTTDHIILMRKNGATINEIANSVGYSRTTIGELLLRSGVAQGERHHVNSTRQPVKWLERMNDWGRLVNVYNEDGSLKGDKNEQY